MRQQLLEKALHALRRVSNYAARNTCMHEDTYRGGVLWEICRACGAKWADDEGGKPEHTDAAELVEANDTIAALEAALASDGRVKLTNDGAAAVDPDYFYRDMDTCPVGTKVILLTEHGIAVLAEWKRSDTDIVGWSPLPKRRPK